MLGETASSVLEGDRVIAIRVLVDRNQIDRVANLRELPLRTPDGIWSSFRKSSTSRKRPANWNCTGRTCARTWP